MYGVNYIGLIPVLIEAIKEQQGQIATLTAQVNSCCASNNGNGKPKLKSAAATTNNEPVAGELQVGIYIYSLIADGQLIGTRQMVITE